MIRSIHMNETKITPREKAILQIIINSGEISQKKLREKLLPEYTISKATLIRDLNTLQEKNIVKVKGEGPATRYLIKKDQHNLPLINLEEYFSQEPDERNVKYKEYNPNLLQKSQILTKEDLEIFEKGKEAFIKNTKSRNEASLKRETERFVIELSWKSSQIEGNTYTLLDTENLLKNNIPAEGHTEEEKIMILNHKKTLEYILQNKKDFKKLNLRNIHQIHELITQDLNIPKDLRKHQVGITGTPYMPLKNPYKIEDAMKFLEKRISETNNIPEAAFLALLFISYIQPFTDGNKRTARLASNALLLANDYYPLSYRSVDEKDYKKALIIFYEQQIYYYFRKIFVDQYKFAVENYFL